MSDILYSIIIPMYNSEKTIERTLDSILTQKGDWKEKIEIIVVNDRSTDNCAEVAQEFLTENAADFKWNILTTSELLENGPGNARQTGIFKAIGKWITFIDADDTFVKDAFITVEDFINQEENKNAKMIISNFMNWNNNNNECLLEFDHDSTWVHGKWYLKDFICSNNIHFKENMFTHEDIYFNTMAISTLVCHNEEPSYLLKSTYKWIIKEDSITRTNYDGHTYVEKYLKDYIYSILEPSLILLRIYPEKSDYFMSQMLTTLLYSYFYYQSFCYTIGEPNVIKDNILYIKELIVAIQSCFGLSIENIVDYAYQNVGYYNDVKQKSQIGTLPFIEVTSYKDFIFKIGKNKIEDENFTEPILNNRDKQIEDNN